MSAESSAMCPRRPSRSGNRNQLIELCLDWSCRFDEYSFTYEKSLNPLTAYPAIFSGLAVAQKVWHISVHLILVCFRLVQQTPTSAKVISLMSNLLCSIVRLNNQLCSVNAAVKGFICVFKNGRVWSSWGDPLRLTGRWNPTINKLTSFFIF